MCEDAFRGALKVSRMDFLGFMRERRSFPVNEVALKSEKDAGGRGLVVNSVLCGVVDELSNGRSRRGSWVRTAVMGVLRWKDLTGVRSSTPTEQKEVGE